MNNSILTEVLKLKLLRPLLEENSQSPFVARQPSKASSLDDALGQLNSTWGVDDNIFAAHIYPLYDNKEDLLYRQYLKDLLQKHSAESRNSSTISASPLKGEVSLAAKGENVDRAM